jgi:hypothetical protein
LFLTLLYELKFKEIILEIKLALSPFLSKINEYFLTFIFLLYYDLYFILFSNLRPNLFCRTDPVVLSVTNWMVLLVQFQWCPNYNSVFYKLPKYCNFTFLCQKEKIYNALGFEFHLILDQKSVSCSLSWKLI